MISDFFCTPGTPLLVEYGQTLVIAAGSLLGAGAVVLYRIMRRRRHRYHPEERDT